MSDSAFNDQSWQVTFLGGAADLSEHPLPHSTAHSNDGPVEGADGSRLPLSMTSVGDRVWIVRIKGGHRMVRRLTDVGIVQGRDVTIMSRTESGSVILAVGGCRIGLGAGMAHRVWVTTTQQGEYQPDPQSQFTQSAPGQSVTENSVNGDSAMQATLHLGALEVGQSGRVLGYEKGNRAYREKLLSMGLTPGTHFTVTRQAPMGDPVEIEVRGFKLSLRKAEATALQIEVITAQEVNHE
ncbi:MAG: FeoA family protein [Leptolyngbyaceae bacterium]|nr:FeoA family protein [Leptolyngbyaceae bacterium]